MTKPLNPESEPGRDRTADRRTVGLDVSSRIGVPARQPAAEVHAASSAVGREPLRQLRDLTQRPVQASGLRCCDPT